MCGVSVGRVVMKIAVLLVLLSGNLPRRSLTSLCWFVPRSFLFAPAVIECRDDRRIEAYVGQNATLPCTYNTSKGRLHACWGRGEVPTFGCTNELIASDGSGVKEGSRASSRYQLLGRLDLGDVSLTILGVTEDDSGVYGCRVAVAGWFNDNKHQVTLVVRKGEKKDEETV